MARKSKADKLKETVFAEILEQAIGKETEEAIVNGATYLNTERALANVSDGCKPSYRRLIYSALQFPKSELQPSSKLLNGMASYHPHSLTGCEPLLASMVRSGVMSGSGSFGTKSILGDEKPAASPRYTKTMLSNLYSEILRPNLQCLKMVESPQGPLEPESLSLVFPLALYMKSLVSGIGYGISTIYPNFSPVSMYKALVEDNPKLLEPNVNLLIDKENSELQRLWETGKGRVIYSYKLTPYTNEDGKDGFMFEGDTCIFTPSLKKIDKYDICVYTGFKKKEVVERLGFPVKILLEDRPDVFENISDTDKKTNPIIAYKQFKENLGLMPKIIKEMEDYFSEEKPDIIVADFIAVPVCFVSKKLNIPWITSIPTPFAIENKATTPAYVGGLYPRDSFIFKLRDKFARRFIRAFKKLLCFILRKQLKELDFTLYNEKGEENIYSPYSILALGMKEIEFRDDFPSQFSWAGPCCSSLFKDSAKFEVETKFEKIILLTKGTHLKWAKNSIIDIARELSQKYPNYLFVVSLGSYLEREKEIIKENNLQVYHYLDYDEILPKVDYVIHHGGAGILYSCIKHNKPAVIIPHDYDQFDYGVRADLAEIAYVANLKSRKSILKAFDKMLERKEWKNLEKLSKAFNNYSPSDLLEKEIDRILKGVKK